MLPLRCFFFFFKQKTAYEMRISDWSSDVCSSDLGFQGGVRRHRVAFRDGLVASACFAAPQGGRARLQVRPLPWPFALCKPHRRDRHGRRRDHRSEEHTSELQSLMRISYAVFCLQNKKTSLQYTITHTVNIIQ